MNHLLKLVLLISALSILGQPALDPDRDQRDVKAVKQAWEWDDGDRIAARMDSSAAAQRLQRHDKQQRRNGVSANSSASTDYPAKAIDIIDGSHDAHLYLPFELFDQLVRLGFADDPQTRSAYRESKDKQRQEAGLPPDMWERLDSLVAPYRSDRKRERDIAFSSLSESDRRLESERLALQVCRDRYVAMREANHQFGPSFKRFLYTAVATSMSSTIVRAQNPKTLAVVNGGCQ